MRPRRAVPADADALARLRFAFRSQLGPAAEVEPVFLERCARWMASRLEDGTWHCWLLEAEGRVIGTVWLHLLEKLPNPVGEPEWHGYVSSLYVEPGLRARGLGSALLAEALAECDRCGCDAVILWPTARSRSLYVRHGFSMRDDLLERRAAPEATP